MSTGYLYDRAYELILGTLARPNIAAYGNTPGRPGITPSPLRVEFDIEKTSIAASNKGAVRISNMAPANRASLRPGILATLSAGYTGLLQALFVGGVTKVDTIREGPDLVTLLEMGDSEAAIQNNILDKSYGAGTTLAQVLTDCATAMQLPSPAQPGGTQFGMALGTPAFTFAKGLTVHGPVRRTLSRLCRTFGLEWSLQNGALQIIPIKHHTGQTAELVTPQTGLLGVPSFDGKMCAFACLLNPKLTPGRLVSIQSQAVNGIFRIRQGKYRGDSHGQMWTCDVEAIPMPIPQVLVPSPRLPLVPDFGA